MILDININSESAVIDSRAWQLNFALLRQFFKHITNWNSFKQKLEIFSNK